ncbi:hypothetical protein ABBQ32_007903 [Trebouxia sp. C0010 RCD-2024]
MRKSHSRKNLDNTVEPDGSMHGSAKGVSRSLSNMKLSRALSASAGKGDHDVSWAQEVYPVTVDEYDLVEVVGKGASATVWLATCKPLNKMVAIKLMDLENFGANLDIVMREAMVMRQQRHPNVLPLLAAFLSEAVLWMVMPYVAGGSAIHILNKRFRGSGYEEPVIATIGRAVLSGLNYMHPRGFIHRDIKGENVLVDADGNVMLADFGVTAAMEPRPTSPKAGATPSPPNFDSLVGGASFQRSDTSTSERSSSSCHCYLERHTFVGTPCFMAPEVMEQEGYYQAADIWAFGILLMELATGHAPYANFSLTNIIIMTMHSPVPQLERSFSDALREVVGKCLDKDPEARPTAAELLKHKFFVKGAKDAAYLKEVLLTDTTDATTPQHSSGSYFAPNSKNKTIGRGMRSISSKRNVQYNAMHAVLASNAFDGKKILKKVTKGTWTNKGCTIDPCTLATAAGVAFTTLHRMQGSTQGFGNGFVLARQGGQDGEPVSWSAPSYFDLMVPGGGAEFSKVELCFVVPDETTLNLFTKGSVGMELPRSRDVELGLASRSDLLQILNHTVHGGKSVQGVTDGSGEQNRRLDKSMFGSRATLGSSNSEDLLLTPTSSSGGNPSDSPGGPTMFQLDSPAVSGLNSSQSARFPVSLERAQSAESIDFALASCNQEPSVAGGNVFQMTDTAHDVGEDSSMHGVRQAQPPLSPAAAEEQQQWSPEQLLQQQQQLQSPAQPVPAQQIPAQQASTQQAPAQQAPPPHRRKLYAYGIADPEYMSLPCKMSMKHARVTVNHETNSRLYGKKVPSQILSGQVDPPVEFLPLYDMLATFHSQSQQGSSSSASSADFGSGSTKPKGVLKRFFSKKG